jgi:hypothetical protein
MLIETINIYQFSPVESSYPFEEEEYIELESPEEQWEKTKWLIDYLITQST